MTHPVETCYPLLTLLHDGAWHTIHTLDTRTVQQAIAQLAAYGVIIEHDMHHGYRLPGGLEWLSATQIVAALSPTVRDAIQIEVVSEIPSTNDYVMAKRANATQAIACFAEYLSAARGQHGRQWATSFGRNLYCSVLSIFEQPPAALLGISLVVAIAVVRALTQYGITEGLQLKWPNDIYWKGRKLAGILIESLPRTTGGCDVIIGIGINGTLPPCAVMQISQPWVDISTITHAPLQRNALASTVLNTLLPVLSQFSTAGLAPFLPEWKQYDFLIDKTVTLHSPAGKIVRGILQGISEQGALLLRTEDGTICTYLSGEVSVRFA